MMQSRYLPPYGAIDDIETEKEKVPKESWKEEEFMKDRVVFMEKEFEEDSCNTLKRQLLYLFTHDAQKPITIYISSYGGSTYDLISLYGLLQTAPCEIHTVALGKCMSAGAYLLLMGDKRFAYPDTRIMFHEVSWSGPYDRLHDKKNDYKEAKHIQEILNKLVRRVTKIKNPEELFKEERFMSPEEAQKLEVIHKIVK